MQKKLTQAGESNQFLAPDLMLDLWYQSPLGQYLIQQLREQLDEFLSTSFGYYAISLGCEYPAQEVLRSCRVKHIFRLGQGGPEQDVCTNGVSLPIASDCTDLVVLMHTLSQSRDAHAILREVNRILIPDGKLIIIDFNPVSLWGLRHLFQSWLDNAPWTGHYYTAGRLKDWASLLGFEQLHHYRCGYMLPFNYLKMVERSRIFSKFSRRWLGFSSALNVLIFEKNTIPLTPIRKHWVKQQILRPKVVRPTVGRGMRYDR